jgi:hypothetical protein
MLSPPARQLIRVSKILLCVGMEGRDGPLGDHELVEREAHPLGEHLQRRDVHRPDRRPPQHRRQSAYAKLLAAEAEALTPRTPGAVRSGDG